MEEIDLDPSDRETFFEALEAAKIDVIAPNVAEEDLNDEDVELINEHKGDVLEIKASGGIKDEHTLIDMINAGATRIGTSSGVKIMESECDCCHEEEENKYEYWKETVR